MKKGKKILYLMMALLLALSTLLGNSSVLDVKAGNGATEILKGTPLFDGQLDEMYKESLTLSTGIGDNAYGTEWSDDYGNIYFLYDDTYLYICADIKDNSVCSRGELYVSQYNPFDNDCCEFRLRLINNGMDEAAVKATTIKVGIDAYGIRAYGLTKDMAATDYSKIQYKTTIIEEGNELGYVIEAAIPHTDGGILDLLNAGELGFKLQLNDLDDDGAYRYFATDYAGEGEKGLVYYPLSDQLVTGGDVNTPPPMIEDKVEVTDYLELSIADDGTYYVPTPESGQSYTTNTETGTLDITYGNPSKWYKDRGWWYIGRLGFSVKDQYSADYPYVRVLYAADLPTGAESVKMAVYDNVGDTVNNDTYIIEPLVKDTNGEFVLSPALRMTDTLTGKLEGGCTVKGAHSFLMFSAAEGQSDGKYQIKSLYFFRSEEAAKNFVVPSEIPELNYQKLSFTTTANYYMPKLLQDWGTAEQNAEMGTVDIKYGNVNPETKWSAGSQYIGKVGFPSAGIYDPEYKYIRVLYSATNPEGVSDVVMKLSNDGGPSMIEFESKVNNTNGEFVLSSTEEMPEDMLERYQLKNGHMSLVFYTDKEGADYKIKAFYFFKTEEEAEEFSPDSELINIKINGNDISNYRIVVPVEGMGNEYTCAQSIVALVNQRTKVKIPIVYDSEPATEYEILIGDTNRSETSGLYDIGGRFHPSYESFTVAQYRIDRVGNKLVFIAAARECMELTLELFAYILDAEAAEGNGTANITTEGIVARGLYPYSLMSWPEVTNVENPVQFTDSFDTDEGYWTADSEKLDQKWVYAADGDNKVFSTGDKATALSYLHVWERNVSFETKLKVAAADNGEVGLLLRQTADDAWVKAGYDFDAKEWFIDVRNGADFLRYRMTSTKEVAFTADQWIDVKAVVNGATAELYVNGTKILEAADLTQLTPGRPGVYAEGVSAMVDDVNISLLSGQGTIWKDAVHTKLPDEIFREGGTVVELSDGTLVYQSRSYDLGSFFSYDNGKTWERENVGDMWSDGVGYPTFLTLQSGKLMRLSYANKEDGSQWERVDISTNDGETWEPVGWICPTMYKGMDIPGGHHVNGLTQMSDGRIFFVMSYEGKVESCRTFCEIYYSDDEGKTWTKSTMDTFDIEGVKVNGYNAAFAEAKILETAEGNLRIYCSANDYGYMVYSESADNGVTWGPMQTMTDLPCSTSSMNFAKDVYAENETTYYLVWCQNSTGKVEINTLNLIPRSRLSVAKTTDGINWVILGDAWHWESRYINDAQAIQHIVDPFITVTEDYVLVGSGISEQVGGNHHAQRQHIWSVAKDTLEETTWKSDDTNHWQESTAGVKVNEAEHIPGAAATATTAQTCTECGYVIAPATGDDEQPANGYTASLKAMASDVTVGATVNVNVAVKHSDENETAFAAGEVVVTYDSTKLTFDEEASKAGLGTATVKVSVEDNVGTLTLEDFGANKNFGNDVYILTFKAVADGSAAVTMTSAAFIDTETSIKEDLITATISPATVTLTVNKVAHSVTLPEGFDGDATVTDGEVYTFSVAEEDGVYYEYSEVTATVDGVPVEVTKNADGTYTIPSVTGKLEISGTRTPKSYDVTRTGTAAEEITDAADKATYGTDYTFTMPTADGFAYKLESLTIDGVAYTDYTVDSATNVYTIPGSAIKGQIAMNISKTATKAAVTVTGSGAGAAAGYAASAVIGEDYVLTIDPENGCTYIVTATMNGTSVEVIEDVENNTYTVQNVTGPIAFTVERVINVEGVEVTNYLTVNANNVWLVKNTTTVEGGKVPTYDGKNMFWSEKYNTYCYLVIAETITADEVTSKVGIVDGTATNVDYSMDVNMSGKVDASDAQLTYNIYNAMYAAFTEDVTMEKLLRADVNYDGKVNTTDAAAIITHILGNN